MDGNNLPHFETATLDLCEETHLARASELLGTTDLKVSCPAEEHDNFDMDRIHTPEGEGGTFYLGTLDGHLTIASINHFGCQIVFARTQDIT